MVEGFNCVNQTSEWISKFLNNTRIYPLQNTDGETETILSYFLSEVGKASKGYWNYKEADRGSRNSYDKSRQRKAQILYTMKEILKLQI